MRCWLLGSTAPVSVRSRPYDAHCPLASEIATVALPVTVSCWTCSATPISFSCPAPGGADASVRYQLPLIDCTGGVIGAVLLASPHAITVAPARSAAQRATVLMLNRPAHCTGWSPTSERQYWCVSNGVDSGEPICESARRDGNRVRRAIRWRLREQHADGPIATIVGPV